jgi:hypothetical protein
VWGIIIICLVLQLSSFFRSCCLVIVRVSFIRIFTYRSFMSYVIISRLSFILSVEMLRARFSEFCVLYWFSSCRCCFKISFSLFAILYVGAFLLLTTGRIGLFGLCSFRWAFRLGGFGFFWIKCLIWILVKVKLLFCSVSRIILQSLFIGFFGIGWIPFSARNVERCIRDKAINFKLIVYLVGCFYWIFEDARNHKP